MKYYELVKDMSNKFNLRLEIVRFSRENGVSEAAREFKTTRKTVRKWRETGMRRITRMACWTGQGPRRRFRTRCRRKKRLRL